MYNVGLTWTVANNTIPHVYASWRYIWTNSVTILSHFSITKSQLYKQFLTISSRSILCTRTNYIYPISPLVNFVNNHQKHANFLLIFYDWPWFPKNAWVVVEKVHSISKNHLHNYKLIGNFMNIILIRFRNRTFPIWSRLGRRSQMRYTRERPFLRFG